MCIQVHSSSVDVHIEYKGNIYIRILVMWVHTFVCMNVYVDLLARQTPIMQFIKPPVCSLRNLTHNR